VSELHPALEKALAALGISSTQIRWRYYRQRDAVMGRLASLRRSKARHKFCHRCGQLATAEDTACPKCQARLLPYWASKVHRALALSGVGSAVSLTFIGLIILLFCLQLSLTRFQGLLSPSHEALTTVGAFSTALFQDGDYWRAFTMGLTHIGIIHLVFNLMAISQTLGAFEEDIGPWPTLVLITLTQVGATAAHMLFHDPETLTAGASGIAFGLIGFGVAYHHRKGHPSQRRFFLQWFAYGLVFGFVMRANNAAHLGGFLTGLPLGYLLAGMRIRHRGIWRMAGILCLMLWVASLGFLARNLSQQRQTLSASITEALPTP
jgi:rhomboid protease GluP